LNETTSLRTTLEAIVHDRRVKEIILVLCSRTTVACRLEAKAAAEKWSIVRICEQKRGRLGGAFREGIRRASGTHVATMFSDLESDPKYLAKMIDAAAASPNHIVVASRWAAGGGFVGYNRV